MNELIPRVKEGAVDTGLSWGPMDAPTRAILDGREVLRRTVDGVFYVGDEPLNGLPGYRLHALVRDLWKILTARVKEG